LTTGGENIVTIQLCRLIKVKIKSG
jgi:hypothetical protein